LEGKFEATGLERGPVREREHGHAAVVVHVVPVADHPAYFSDLMAPDAMEEDR
jgi:hypothetical protein